MSRKRLEEKEKRVTIIFSVKRKHAAKARAKAIEIQNRYDKLDWDERVRYPKADQ